MAYQSLDSEGRLIDFNHKLCDQGYSPAELLGRSFGEFWAQDARPDFSAQFVAQLKQACEVSSELRLLRKDGAEICVLLEGRVQRDQDGRFIQSRILSDITERRRSDCGFNTPTGSMPC